MRKHRLTRYLAVFFVIVVIIPAVILGLLAVRSISHEEAYIEKQIEGTLAAEVAHAASLVNTELARIQAELAQTIPAHRGKDPSDSLDKWKNRSSLVEIPFMLSPTHEILWPRAEHKQDSEATSFVTEQRAFFSDEVEVPVYENIAVAYKEEILEGPTEDLEVTEDTAAAAEEPLVVAHLDQASQAPEQEADRVLGGSAVSDVVSGAEVTSESDEPRRQAVSPPRAKRVAAGEKGDRLGAGDSRRAVVPTAGQVEEERGGASEGVSEFTGLQAERRDLERTPGLGALEAGRTDAYGVDHQQAADKKVARGEFSAAQQAISKFRQSEPIRKKVYDKAESEGQVVSYRNVELAREPQTRSQPPREVQELKSVFVSRMLNFSEIVARGRNGIIPQVMGGRLRLLYWQKVVGGNLVACLIDADEIRERIIGVLPAIYSSARILTVLDENSQPLIIPEGQGTRDWRRPFVAQEISELLPRWEAAAYLTNPDVISSRAHVATSVMWILIFIMFVSIVTGGMLVLRSAAAEVRLAQQRTTFVANVSHELKTPLTSIRMFAEMLREGRQPDEVKRNHYLDIMTSETERLTRLINNVLDFSRMEQGKKRYSMKPCDVVGLCSDVIENQRARLENNGFTVGFAPEVDRVLVHADEEAIKQALVNLLSNAEKYSDKVKRIEICISRDNGAVAIDISDRGIGIPPGEARKIFTEFYRVDDALTSRVKGTGLGLTIARRVVRDHGGDIQYVARAEGGSTFRLTLPTVEEQP